MYAIAAIGDLILLLIGLVILRACFRSIKLYALTVGFIVVMSFAAVVNIIASLIVVMLGVLVLLILDSMMFIE